MIMCYQVRNHVLKIMLVILEASFLEQKSVLIFNKAFAINSSHFVEQQTFLCIVIIVIVTVVYARFKLHSLAVVIL